MILYKFLKSLYQSIKYCRIIDKVDNDEHFYSGLSKIMGCKFKKDWIHRAYTVINPQVRNGEYDPNSEVYELGSDKASRAYVENYIWGILNIVGKTLQVENLFDVLTYELKRIDEHNNFLFMMYPIPYRETMKWGKWLLVELAVIVLGCISFCLYF